MKKIITALAVLILTMPVFAADKDNVMIKIKTNYGDITAELFSEKAPETVGNFLKYAEEDFYNGTIFHRVIRDFMIQGGGFDEEFNKKDTRAPISNEASNGLKNKRGTLAMARTSVPHSATSQFFINLKDNHFLDHYMPSGDGWGYAVFGEVTDGMDVVDKIGAVTTHNRGRMGDVPVENVVIEDVEIVD